MRAARARAINAHSFVSHMRALECLSYARIMRVYAPLASARICLFDDCAYIYVHFIYFLVASTARDWQATAGGDGRLPDYMYIGFIFPSNSGVLKCVIHLKTPLFNSRLIENQNYKQVKLYGFNIIMCIYMYWIGCIYRGGYTLNSWWFVNWLI